LEDAGQHLAAVWGEPDERGGAVIRVGFGDREPPRKQIVGAAAAMSERKPRLIAAGEAALRSWQ